MSSPNSTDTVGPSSPNSTQLDTVGPGSSNTTQLMSVFSTLLTTNDPSEKTVLPTATAASEDSNITQIQPLIFLQTQAAQGIAGTFAVAAILITVHQARLNKIISLF